MITVNQFHESTFNCFNQESIIESEEIVCAATQIVRGIAAFVKKKKSIFEFNVQVIGSMQAGTKPFRPIETDILCVFQRIETLKPCYSNAYEI